MKSFVKIINDTKAYRAKAFLAYLFIGCLFMAALGQTGLITAKAEDSKKESSAGIKNLVTTPADLPSETATMMEDLAAAAARGDIEELRDLFESNELAPVLDENHISDPIAHWKTTSGDGTARDIMAALAELFSLPPVKTENGDFLWPYLAATPLDKLTKPQQIDLYRLVGPENAARMLKQNRYDYYETEIGKDGTWHFFKKSDNKAKIRNKTIEKKADKK